MGFILSSPPIPSPAQKSPKNEKTPEYLPRPIEHKYSLIIDQYPNKTQMISRNPVIIARQIPYKIMSTYHQRVPILRNNLVSVLPTNVNKSLQVSDTFKGEYGVALMGAYMFALMGVMSWVYYQDVDYYTQLNQQYRENIQTLTDKNTCYLIKIGYLEDRINRLEHILLENKPER